MKGPSLSTTWSSSGYKIIGGLPYNFDLPKLLAANNPNGATSVFNFRQTWK